MKSLPRIEGALQDALATVTTGCPPGLAAALRHAVFPGGMRVRPRLCLAVAHACGAVDSPVAEGAAAAIELLHCGSLVHDDLPCFDNAAIRRGLPSVHQKFGEPLAVLAGDGLIVLAVETLVHAAAHSPDLGQLLLLLTQAAGMPSGLIAGQAWESEPKVPLVAYQRAKTASLFTFATMSGALAAEMPAEPWRLLGERLGEAYQIADDLRDMAMTSEELGKPAGQDAALGRPSAAARHGMAGAVGKVEGLVRSAIAAVPPCREPGLLKTLILAELGRLLPKELVLLAAA
ncbi:polyprenyl synthetase family protein [Acidisoma cladoniae]|uniref:polyprenyl synthetase family protein n=1 Tax=Acidisoma cladoniae TaxID=3040935 RepID=UPI00254B3AEF|nr:polyprenyl synthetase family protein [Acidisoma sp. PAMC 29798]